MENVVIYVYSGKGGVGKSTVATNLAYLFKSREVGLFDADLEGPSIPSLLSGMKMDKKMSFIDMHIEPAVIGGIKVISTGFIGSKNENLYMSGRVLDGALDQLLYQVNWNVDILIIDLPPGTGDIHRNIIYNTKGRCILVTIPQQVSYEDTQKGVDFLKKLEVDIIGVIENMGSFTCTKCCSTFPVFGGNTEQELLVPNDLNLLLSIPIMSELSSVSNHVPFVLQYPNHPISQKLQEIASYIESFLSV